ncbi:DUF262 domain-containing HNH endonuclease family protein [Sporosarcina oncorhynchi]|uniref:DUF262 domain-containing HNH endonuclease family protein n=1 Tax=Sporosarcina oncorhynchi TaxID=3056444 RepID=A0ABZ0L3A9_9BACL|nr:DUF262 domain-containing HNH endonuclease family protein [Sporosarcina sp. T2O-4]WOV86963.1 DUF262 domain-containing HNH endonuclease family protein [Sporosarcina sp. T2O-4]
MSNSKQFYSDGLVNIERLLNGQDYYEIPVLQRNYVWSKDNIKNLMTDIKESMDEDLTQDYFIGSMVFSEGKDRKIVVDGQQRITTLSLIFAVAVARFKEDEDTDYIGLYSSYLYKKTPDDDGVIQSMNRLKHHDRDNHFFTELISNNAIGTSVTTSQTNMVTARETIEDELSSFKEDHELKRFMNYLAKRVHIVSMVTSDLNMAFRIFETLNDRGAKLQPEDLLKNMLLRNLSDGSYDQVAKSWDNFINVLTSDNGKLLVPTSTFLKHYVMSKGDMVQKAKLYKWFDDLTQLPAENQIKLLGYELNTNEGINAFISELEEEAKIYAKALSGNFEESIDNCIALGVKQVLIMVLASKKLDETKRKKVFTLMESLIFSYVITASRFNVVEKSLFKIAGKIRSADAKPALFDEAIEDIEALILEKKEQALTALVEFKMKKSDRKKAKYILSKLGESLDDIDHSGFTIEHIMPEEKSAGWKHVKESAEDYEALVSSIGNLTLINPSGNSSLKNKDFDSKRQVYSNQTMLTKTIVESVYTGTKNTKHDKAIKAFNYDRVSGAWNKREIERRAKALRDLAEHIWFKF